ncbi:MAG: CBS domain-containing protein [Solirubrobacterales bacterium]|nr:CBS domain-containing protein [Solirubrobacterales bacterium]MBV9808796.1 CBS domain-containing protein [Solirubrobacterales bacterium]
MSTTLGREDALALTVGEVMIRAPKTLPAGASLGEVRRLFDRPNVRTVLLTEGGAFVGAIERDRMPVDGPDSTPARECAQPEPATATPRMPMFEALKLLEARDEPRLVVLDEDGVTLRGLLCANADATGFCIRP